MVAHRLCRSEDEAVAAWRELGGPVAVKACSPTCRTRANTARSRCASTTRASGRASWRAQSAALARLGARAEGVLVARMAAGAHECMVGAHWDPVFGPVLVVGAGGKYVEALHDTAVLLAPCREADVARALAGLRIAPLLAGVRGEAVADVAALCRVAAGVGEMMARGGGAIRAIDVNPVMVGAEGVVIVDALIEMAA